MLGLDELQTFLPHRGKMLLLSRIIDYNIEGNIRAEYDITENCLFYDPVTEGVPVWTGFEFIAQAISVLSGIRSREKGLPPKIGFILSVPSMKIEIPFFQSGSTIDIHARECDCIDLIYTFEGEIFIEGRKAAEGKIMVMEINDEKKLIDLKGA